MISVNVWDKSMVGPVEKAIRAAGLGLNPIVDGQTLRIPVPPLTEERRKDLAKLAGKYTEQQKIAVRNVRRDANEDLKKAEKAGEISQDEQKKMETEVQKDTDELWEFSYRPSADGKGLTRVEGATGGTATAVAEPGTFTVRVVCDPKSYLYLNGTTIDFKDEIMGRGFVFSNPNASTTCGCGSSFSA
jgi:hypothetical protein